MNFTGSCPVHSNRKSRYHYFYVCKSASGANVGATESIEKASAWAQNSGGTFEQVADFDDPKQSNAGVRQPKDVPANNHDAAIDAPNPRWRPGAEPSGIPAQRTSLPAEVGMSGHDRTSQADGRVSEGATRIAVERARQVEVEGYNSTEDADGEDDLALAGAVYALSAAGGFSNRLGDPKRRVWEHIWPWAVECYKPKTAIRDLERAGALIAAEIDRRLSRGESLVATERKDADSEAVALLVPRCDEHGTYKSWESFYHRYLCRECDLWPCASCDGSRRVRHERGYMDTCPTCKGEGLVKGRHNPDRMAYDPKAGFIRRLGDFETTIPRDSGAQK